METNAAIPTFEHFVRETEQSVQFFARKFGLAVEEVRQIAFVAYADSSATYLPDHVSGASFASYALATLERMARASAHSMHDDLDSPDGFDDEQGGEADAPTYVLDGRRVYDRSASVSQFAAEVGVTSLLVQHFEELALPDAIKSHPIYTKPKFRALLDAVLARKSVPEIAAVVKVSVGRVYQMIFELESHLNERDVIRLDRMVELDENGTAPGDVIQRRPLSGLHYRSANERNLPRLLHAMQRMLRYGQVQPVVVDQFQRVLVGEEDCMAASILGISHVRTILRHLRDATYESGPELEHLRNDLADGPVNPYENLDVIPSFLRRVQNGTLSPLVATRLAHLPKRHQEHVAGALGGILACLLSLTDANDLVTSYDDSRDAARTNFEKMLKRKSEHVLRRLRNEPDAADGESE